MNRLIGLLSIAVLFAYAFPGAAAQAKADSVTLEVMNPMGVIEPPATLGLSQRIGKLDGKKIALMHNNKPGASNLLDALEKILSKKFPAATFVRGYETEPVQPPKDPEMYRKAAAASDAFIFAMGD